MNAYTQLDTQGNMIQFTLKSHFYESWAFWDFQKHNQIKKVMLSVEPTDDYFIGYLKCLKNNYNNTDFLSKVRRNMDNLTLLLLAKGIAPTQQARYDYLENLKT